MIADWKERVRKTPKSPIVIREKANGNDSKEISFETKSGRKLSEEDRHEIVSTVFRFSDRFNRFYL